MFDAGNLNSRNINWVKLNRAVAKINCLDSDIQYTPSKDLKFKHHGLPQSTIDDCQSNALPAMEDMKRKHLQARTKFLGHIDLPNLRNNL